LELIYDESYEISPYNWKKIEGYPALSHGIKTENDLRVAVINNPHQGNGTTKKSFIGIVGDDILSLPMEIHPQPSVFNKVLCSSKILNEYMVETVKEAALEVGTDITDEDITVAGKMFDPTPEYYKPRRSRSFYEYRRCPKRKTRKSNWAHRCLLCTSNLVTGFP
jgi:hypothetical protein